MIPVTHRPNQQLNIDISLKNMLVRPIKDNEREQWDSLMSQYHYLGFNRLVGESIRYFAFLEGEPVALTGWASAAYKSSHRDQWIGWGPEQRIKRLKFIANNSRFLILPGIRIKNLASRILSLNLKRISLDWQKAYGHPIVLTETFVDHNRFQGTCYRAAGWEPLGRTKGYGRNAGRYYKHSHTKTIYIKPLNNRAAQMLSAPFLPDHLTGRKAVIDINSVDIEHLVKTLCSIDDPRNARGQQHSHVSTLAVGLCARLSGLRTYLQMSYWAKTLTQDQLKRFGCRLDENKRCYVPPSEPTIRRIFTSVDQEQFKKIVQEQIFYDTLLPSWITAPHPVPRGCNEP